MSEFSEEFVSQLRQVFDVCDVENSGSISTEHLLTLAGQHFGSSQNSVTAAVAGLGVTGDVINFPQFCQVVATILLEAQQGVGEDPGGGSDDLDGCMISTPLEDSPVTSRAASQYRFQRVAELEEVEEEGHHLDSLPHIILEDTHTQGSLVGLPNGRMPSSERVSPFSLNDVDLDSALGGSTASPESTRKSHSGCSSMSDREEENFECYGEAEDIECDSDSARIGVKSGVADEVAREDPLSISHGKENDPEYLRQKVQMLQQQVGVLAENQINSDDRFTRCKQDNATYQARSLMLEEQLREAELRGEDRLSEEQRRNKELIGRIEREKQLTIENYTIKLTSLEKERNSIDEENKRLKPVLEKLQKDKEHLEDRVSEAEFSASALLQENAKLNQFQQRQKEEVKAEQDRSAKVIEELRCEIERLRAADEAARKRSPSIDPQAAQNIELQSTIKQLREENKSLTEQVEDIQAQLLTTTLEEGRTLVNATNNNSLAAEFEQMTNEELKNSLKKEQEANVHLRAYIDGILINIVENYPQLLEIKQK